jgi:hypothetical protein
VEISVGTDPHRSSVFAAPSESPTIFVSIAAYRDPLLVPTVEDCIAKATRPAALRFGICWQRDRSDPDLPFRADERFRVLDYDWHESQGIGWARAECMCLFDGEDFYLQLDSHHRFVEGWDEKLLRYMELSGSPKPVLTAHARNFDPNEPGVVPRELPSIRFARWDGHIPLFRPGVIPAKERLTRPTRARSISGHFCFSVGDFVRDVPCDPEIYHYGGAETTVAVRAFTSGYDLFHPPEPILSHAYAVARVDRKTYWGDHKDDWRERAKLSKERVVEFLTKPHTGDYGCGAVRTVSDYEAYAGLSFRHCRAQDYTHINKEPPNPPSPTGWAEEVQVWNVRLSLRPLALPAGFAEADAWRVGLADALGGHIHDEVLDGREVSRLLAGGSSEPTIELTFQSAQEPAVWLIHAEREGNELKAVDGFVGRGTKHGRASIYQ